MKKISILALLVFALAVPGLMLAQSTTQQPAAQADPGMTQQSNPASPGMTQPPDQNGQAAQPEASEPSQTQPSPSQMPSDQTATGGANGMNSQSGQTMSGTISADGKTFTGNNQTYTISNPNSVKAYASQTVSVEYEMDTNNSIRVTKIMLPQPKQ